MEPLLHSNNPELHELARFVAEKSAKSDEKAGSAITQKAFEVLKTIQQNRNTYYADKEQLARMEHDVKTIRTEINKVSSELWHEHEEKEGLPETLNQALASMANLLTVKSLLLQEVWHFYHGDLLSKGIAELTTKAQPGEAKKLASDFVRAYTEKLLKEAYEQDKMPHYLLRDSSSVTNEPGQEHIVLSYITSGGEIHHSMLTYTALQDEKKWIHHDSRKCSKSLHSLIKAVLTDSIGITRSEQKATHFSASYSY